MTVTSFTAPSAVLERIFANLQQELEDNIPEEDLEKYRSWGAIDKAPDMPMFDDVRHKLSIDVPIYARIPTNRCNVDRSYDRDVNWANIKKFLWDTRGFSFDACQAIEVIYVASADIFIVIIGQHRVIMCSATLGLLATIPAKIRLLDESLSEEDQIIAESKIHHREANQVTDQKPHERGNSGFIAGDSKSVLNVNFCASLNLGMKGTLHLFPNNDFKKVVDSQWALTKARDITKDNPKDLEFALELLRDYLDGDKIDGRTIISTCAFLTHFDKQLRDTAQNNAMSKEEFVKAIFKTSFIDDGVTTDELSLGTKNFRGENSVIIVARLVKLTNAYCKSRLNNITLADGRKKSRRSKWISSTDKPWILFLIATKTDDWLKQIPNGIIDTI